MRKLLLILSIALPLAASAAEAPSQVHTKKIHPTVEELASMYFFHHPHLEQSLAQLVSPHGVQAVVAAASEHKNVLNGPDVLLRKARKICAELQKAQTGEEFAEVLTRWDQDERAEGRQHAAQLLARLDPDDRKALEGFLDTEYRNGSTSAVLDYRALIANRPFPSETSNRMMRSVCEDVPGAAPREQ